MQCGLHAWVMESPAGGSPVAGGGDGAPAAPVAIDGIAVAMRMVAAAESCSSGQCSQIGIGEKRHR